MAGALASHYKRDLTHQPKFDKQVEESAESLMFGIGRILAGRDLGVKRTDTTF
ncbi:hypothetical protein [Streptomyces sp. NPDC050164]|uniref:hypothetical protein n=1 Tax=Streptomyces sp. NPDC050164 TaxID=3365605 RepID=UPI00379E94D0